MIGRFRSALIFTALAHAVIEFCGNYLPVLYPVLIPVMGLSFAQIGIVALVSSTALSLSQPIFGYFSDRWGSIPLVTISIIWIGVAMGLVGFAHSYIALLMLVTLGSLGSGAFHPPATVTAAENSGINRGAGMSIFSVGGNIGAALSPLWMVLALGWMGLAATITVLPVAVIFAIVFYMRMRPRTITASPVETSSEQAHPVARRFLLGMLLIVTAMMFRSWYQVALMTYLPTWVETTGGTLAAGSQMLAVFLFSTSIGSIVGGVSGDRFGHLAVLVLALFTLPIMHATFMQTTGAMQVGALFLSGVAVGSTFPTSIVLVLEAWPTRAGVATGLLMGLGWWPGGLGTSLTGLLADRYSLTSALMTLILVPLLGVVCLLLYGLLSRSRMSPATGDS